MEKIFGNAVLLSATVIVACLVIFPPLHLWAQNDIKIDEKVKVHKAVVVDTNEQNHSLTVKIDESEVPVIMQASTTIFLGNGEEATFDNVQPGTNLYVFGSYDSEARNIAAEKLVIRNKRITERTSLSRAEQERVNSSFTLPSFDTLGLSTK